MNNINLPNYMKWIIMIICVPVVYVATRILFFLIFMVQHFFKEGNFEVFEEKFNMHIFTPIASTYLTIIAVSHLAPKNKLRASQIAGVFFVVISIENMINGNEEFWLNLSFSLDFIGAILANIYLYYKFQNNKTEN